MSVLDKAANAVYWARDFAQERIDSIQYAVHSPWYVGYLVATGVSVLALSMLALDGHLQDRRFRKYLSGLKPKIEAECRDADPARLALFRDCLSSIGEVSPEEMWLNLRGAVKNAPGKSSSGDLAMELGRAKKAYGKLEPLEKKGAIHTDAGLAIEIRLKEVAAFYIDVIGATEKERTVVPQAEAAMQNGQKTESL